MGQVIGHVVAAKRQHSEWIAAEHAGLTERRGSGFRTAGRSQENAVRPVERFVHQRNRPRPPAAEQDRRERHAFGLLPIGIDGRALRGGRCEARVRMRRFATAARRPFLPFPINRAGGSRNAGILPPNIALGRERDVGKDAVFCERVHRVRICLPRCAGRDAEETRLGIQRVKASILAEPNPRDVITQAGNLPVRQRGQHHCQIGLAAGAGERGGDVLLAAAGRGQSEDEHVLRQPAFLSRHHRRDAQGKTFLAQQRVAAVTRPVRPDGRFIRKMDDVFLLRIGLARPGDVILAGLERRANRMQARRRPACRAPPGPCAS